MREREIWINNISSRWPAFEWILKKDMFTQTKICWRSLRIFFYSEGGRCVWDGWWWSCQRSSDCIDPVKPPGLHTSVVHYCHTTATSNLQSSVITTRNWVRPSRTSGEKQQDLHQPVCRWTQHYDICNILGWQNPILTGKQWKVHQIYLWRSLDGSLLRLACFNVWVRPK